MIEQTGEKLDAKNEILDSVLEIARFRFYVKLQP